MSAEVYVGLGANLGDPQSTFEKALNLIEEFCQIVSVSKLYHSAPWGVLDQPPFINAAARLSTKLPPDILIHKFQETERKLGKKVIHKNGPRSIDIDILLYGDLSIETKDLVLPHPRILERDFVLCPLLDLNPRLYHPTWGNQTLKSALDRLQEKFVQKEPVSWDRKL